MQTKPRTTTRGIPTATNVDHVGWTVPDLEQGVAFLVNVLGGEEIFRAGPFADPSGEWMTTHFAVHPRASTNVVMIRLGSTQVVELLAWESPDGLGDWPRPSNLGATHLAIHVGDVVAAMDYLEAHGCVAYGDPVLLESVPQAGVTILQVQTPIGLWLELFSYPDHELPYEATTAVRLLPKAKEWRNE
ncbi:VOC family protein [Lacisediminihabitans profunda]|uniref:VOC family protein n=1 Tax=Lacisediminihabitans profunda TaxID=2594790 RepID=A0A5C8URN7_9MICO|nr:VOC family protein [Lacisediminihabitans profunda]TXN30572.1 VOC family protein [Lacisediminihabitans profunda]